MAISLRKNIMTAFAYDVKAGKVFAEKVKSELCVGTRTFGGLQTKFGFEAIVRYKDLNNLKKLKENLKICEGYELSMHAPLNHDFPETVDLCTEQGYDVARRLVDAS